MPDSFEFFWLFIHPCAFHCCSCSCGGALQSLWMEATLCNVCETPFCGWLMTSGYSISLQATLECTCKSRQKAPVFFAYQKAPDGNILLFWLKSTQWLCVLYSGQCIVVLIRLHECRLHLWKSANRSVWPSRACTLTSQAKSKHQVVQATFKSYVDSVTQQEIFSFMP